MGSGGLMGRRLAALLDSRSSRFDLGVFAAGVVVVIGACVRCLEDGITGGLLQLLTIPLIVLIARFPMVLDNGKGGVEIAFDSSVLIFLLCMFDGPQALLLWTAGVVITQLTADKRLMVRLFNVGIGILSGTAAALVFARVGAEEGSLAELLAVALAAACYFAGDLVLSAVSVAVETGSSLKSHLVQAGTLFAVACFVPFDSLGYLGAVLVRRSDPPDWTLILLAVPLATLLIASRAVTRGRENSRRLTVLFEAAQQAQELSKKDEVVKALREDARKL